MLSKPKVIFFHPYFSDGGVERTNIYLARGLIAKGYKVAFVTIMPTLTFLPEVRSLGIEWVVLPAKSTFTAQPAFLRWIRNQQSVEHQLVVISCQYYVNLICLMFRPLWGSRVFHILSERNHLNEFKVHRSFKYSLIERLVRFFYSFADMVIANSKELASDLSNATGCPVDVVYNPTINDRLYRLAEESITEEWFHDENRPIVLAVGRLSPQKDFATLILAFSMLQKVHNGRLIILGEGTEREKLETKAKDLGISGDLLMPGFVLNPYKFMKKASLFVLSSVYEGLPNVLIEAVALKVPVVSTACRSGPTEILLRGKVGQLVPVGDAEALAEAMSNALKNPKEVQLMVRSAGESLSRFEPESAVESLVALFQGKHL